MCLGYVWNGIYFLALIEYFIVLKHMFFKPWLRMLSPRLKNLFHNVSCAICCMLLSRLEMHLLPHCIKIACHFTFFLIFDEPL